MYSGLIEIVGFLVAFSVGVTIGLMIYEAYRGIQTAKKQEKPLKKPKVLYYKDSTPTKTKAKESEETPLQPYIISPHQEKQKDLKESGGGS